MLKNMRLEACYDLQSVRLLNSFPGVPKPVSAARSVVNVDLTNTMLPKKAIDAMKDNPQMRLSGLLTKEDAFGDDDISSSDEESGPELKIMHFASTDNCFYKRLAAGMGEKVGVRLRHKCRGGRVVQE